MFGYSPAEAQARLIALCLPMQAERAVTPGTFWNEATYILPRAWTIRISGSAGIRGLQP